MSTANPIASRPPKVQPWHLDRLAVVYVRQSSVQQVLENRESTERQYALADRAVACGWRARPHPGHRRGPGQERQHLRRPARVPTAPRRGRARSRRADPGHRDESARALLQGLASTPRTLRHLPDAAGRSRRAIRSHRPPRPAPVGAQGHDERGRTPRPARAPCARPAQARRAAGRSTWRPRSVTSAHPKAGSNRTPMNRCGGRHPCVRVVRSTGQRPQPWSRHS